ncbi:chord-domain-containing protein [Macrolepiota fuliginosa MF-IS2]|uniref:Chord-domain-containing protein n=1 Tax=Macrolepiota fuliginosa MF-IS2 TaxID=1400762 RepID=A0A9P5XLZ1_9AGAR|nr:chord-domain-containing protein [Macrolepiota fuliginosa MF-IS2]
MPRCSRRGCNSEYTEGSTDKCVHHPGAPVFHEGLKSWSCCSDTNKSVLSFDDFLAIPGCTEVDGHTSEAPKAPESKISSTTTFSVMESSADGETYSTTGAAAPKTLSQADPEPVQPAPAVEEEDDPTVPVAPGTQCKRKGCGVLFVSNEENRGGDGPGTICVYHSAPPIFREGSKGYLCCKRRVLEFDEFLKIQGCRTGRHVFAPRGSTEEMINCRIDHYQTRDKVYVSVFARQADRERSIIKFDTPEQITLDVYLPGPKRFSRVLNLSGPIVPDQCTYRFFNTKVELELQKSDNRGWVLLEKTSRDLGGINYTFGVGGRTGTVGGKELQLDATRSS